MSSMRLAQHPTALRTAFGVRNVSARSAKKPRHACSVPTIVGTQRVYRHATTAMRDNEYIFVYVELKTTEQYMQSAPSAQTECVAQSFNLYKTNSTPLRPPDAAWFRYYYRGSKICYQVYYCYAFLCRRRGNSSVRLLSGPHFYIGDNSGGNTWD